MRLRLTTEVAQFFDGLELLDQGLAPLTGWKPASGDGDAPGDDLASYTGIGWRSGPHAGRDVVPSEPRRHTPFSAVLLLR